MSSTLRTVAQIPARNKYLVGVGSATSGALSAATTAGVVADDCYAFTCNESALSSSLLPSGTTAISGAVKADYAAGDLFKDLGRQLVIYDSATDAHIAVFREVQPVDNAGTEGVGATGGTPLFIKVWAASGLGVLVARTGPGAH
jgi:hypothetical protein